MTKPHVLFNITLHGHQPVGNLAWVMEDGYERCYKPFLDLFARYPAIRFSYHLSGCLLEWLLEHHPDHLELLAEMVHRGQVELIGGAFYEPILTAVPQRDALAQIRLHQEFTRSHFDSEARGIWIPERVWEPSLPSLLSRAAVGFTLLDDTHFLAAGQQRKDLHGYFLTEDQGELLAVFPIFESLRYTIPFAEPDETFRILRTFAETAPGTMLAYGDDVEKFGVWPDTFQLCYENGWLKRFLTALEENLPWLHLVSLRDAVATLPPRGLTYLPETSYAEMNEWALPADLAPVYSRARAHVAQDPDLAPALPFVRGSSWRNFRVKYPEIRRLYGRVLSISRRMAALPEDPLTTEAKQELYRAQCNCPYWHGIFGGHYLPHLREAVWRHLLKAELLADALTPRRDDTRVLLDQADVDLDGHDEILVRNEHLGIVVSPQGARAFEIDLRPWGLNLCSVLARRNEAYHAAVKALEKQDEGAVKSIHDLKRAKDPDLAAALHYDQYEHLGYTDLILTERPEAADFAGGKLRDAHGLHAVRWHVETRSEDGGPAVTFTSPAHGAPIRIAKTFRLEERSLTVAYSVAEANGEPWYGFLAVEVPIALQTGSSPQRVWTDAKGRILGPLGDSLMGTEHAIAVCDWDHDLGVKLRAEGSQVLTYAVKTVSQSEAGFEGVHQHAVVVFLYDLRLREHEVRQWVITLSASRAPERVTTGALGLKA